jgi:2-phosphosulfolactate phosphatase
MKLELYFTPKEINEGDLQDRLVLVVDVLRVSTTIAYALKNDCKDIIPTDSIESALELAQKIGRENILLCGERLGLKIEGFDLGNSPQEYIPEKISGKTLVFASTNGTKAIVKGSKGAKLIVGSFVNFDAVLNYIFSNPSDLAIICSGKFGQFSLEDSVCAGMFVQKLSEKFSGIIKNDASFAAIYFSQIFQENILEMLKLSTHGKYLMELGFESDLPVCAKLNSVNLVPILSEGKLVKYEE